MHSALCLAAAAVAIAQIHVASAGHCFGFSSKAACLKMPQGGQSECKWCEGQGCMMENSQCALQNVVSRCSLQTSCGDCLQTGGSYARGCRWCPTSGSCHIMSPYINDPTPCSKKERRSHWTSSEYFRNSYVDRKQCGDTPALPGTPYFKAANDEFSTAPGTNPTQRNYGVAITDVDGDGLFDAFVAGYTGPDLVFSWKKNKLTNIKDQAVPGTKDRKTLGVTACDLDGDGHEEIYLLNLDRYSGACDKSNPSLPFDQIFTKTKKDGAFSDMLQDRAKHKDGMSCASGRSVGCIDRTGEGKYSIFISNYADASREPKPMLVELDEQGRLVDRAKALKMDNANGGRAVVAGQLYSEHVSLFVNNEGGSNGNDGKNYLYAGQPGGTYSQVAKDMGVEDARNTGRGTIMMDANGDGVLDIIYGNWNGPHRMFIQHASKKFIDAAPDDLAKPSPIRTVIAADWDNDGFEEIFYNNIPGVNRLFSVFGNQSTLAGHKWTEHNIGDAEEATGFGTGAGVADFDGDGRLELLVSHGESASQPVTFYRPTGGEGNHYIRIMPLTKSGAPARGALVHLRMTDGRVQTRTIDGGSGYLCAQEPVAHFGLGKETTFDAVIIRWPSVAKTAVYKAADLKIDAIHRIKHIADQPAPATTQPGASAAATTPATTQTGVGGVAIPQQQWSGKTIDDLHNEYYTIFSRSANRNAASHLWAAFIMKRSAGMSTALYQTMFTGFCPISGSPVSGAHNLFPMELKHVTGGMRNGSVYYCCWPCVCDTQAHVRVDDRTVKTADGSVSHQYLVIGDPCSDPDGIPEAAPELTCKNGRLEGAIRSDNDFIIIGMLHQETVDQPVGHSDAEIQGACKSRAAQGFQSGMGKIFIEVANINPVKTVSPQIATQGIPATGNVVFTPAPAKTDAPVSVQTTSYSASPGPSAARATTTPDEGKTSASSAPASASATTTGRPGPASATNTVSVRVPATARMTAHTSTRASTFAAATAAVDTHTTSHASTTRSTASAIDTTAVATARSSPGHRVTAAAATRTNASTPLAVTVVLPAKKGSDAADRKQQQPNAARPGYAGGSSGAAMGGGRDDTSSSSGGAGGNDAVVPAVVGAGVVVLLCIGAAVFVASNQKATAEGGRVNYDNPTYGDGGVIVNPTDQARQQEQII